MYEELITNLRNCAETNSLSRYKRDLMKQAADAIEELSKSLDDMNEANIALYGALPKWIPVTERLPEGKTNVLCCGEKGGMFVGWTGSYVFEGKVNAFVHGGSGRNITHWMPLPQPPKEET